MEEINIKDFFSYLKRYILAFVIVVVVAVVGVAIYDKVLKEPIYQAQTTVVIAKSDTATPENSSAATLSDINASQKLATTYSEIAKSELVLNQVIENLGLHESVKDLSKNLSIKPVDDTAILGITAKDQNPRLAAISSSVGSRPSFSVSFILTDLILLILPADCTGMRITRDWLARARRMDCLIHQAA